MVKNNGIKIIVKINTLCFVNIENKRVQLFYLVIIEAKPAGGFFARLMAPAIGKQNAANVKKQDFYRQCFHPAYTLLFWSSIACSSFSKGLLNLSMPSSSSCWVILSMSIPAA